MNIEYSKFYMDKIYIVIYMYDFILKVFVFFWFVIIDLEINIGFFLKIIMINYLWRKYRIK